MKRDAIVIVVGAGHAGLEAAFAVDRLGGQAILVTMTPDDLGVLSCNPALGGIGKGHLLAEIDALGGMAPTWGDAAAIQYRLLNASKGPAVQGPRTQIDRAIYARTVRNAVNTSAIELVYGEVTDLLLTDSQATGVVLADGTSIEGDAVILTTGTFLGGMIHIGDERRPAGRDGMRASTRLADRMHEAGMVNGRLKTGTPARLARRSIAWDEVDRQSGDVTPRFLARETTHVAQPQIDCGVTATNQETHDIICGALDRSALYGGHITGQGPRYCPSVEDKVQRFAHRDSHPIYLEPEGLTSDRVYPNGISTSLPLDVQTRMIHSIKGLERAEIIRPGYAIEYDFCDPRGLRTDLESRTWPRLFLAGQINGTTGYEEAAAQGLVAALGAVQAVRGQDRAAFDRSTSYIGVLVDDLTTRGVTEPYRMFTSRAEFRLYLRCDNAEARLAEWAGDVGLLPSDRLARARERIGTVRRLVEARSTVETKDPRIAQAVAAEILYAPYMERQERERRRLAENEAIRLPADMSFDLAGLTVQQREVLTARRPETLGSALKLEVMSPAAGLVLLAAARG